MMRLLYIWLIRLSTLELEHYILESDLQFTLNVLFRFILIGRNRNLLVFYGRQLVESILSRNFQNTRLRKGNRWIYERELFRILLQNFNRKGLLPIWKKKVMMLLTFYNVLNLLERVI